MVSKSDTDAVNRHYILFAQKLKENGFSGEIDLSYAGRVALATDNSIYQVMPEGVIYPRSTHDVSLMMKLSTRSEYREVIFAARGGGTGTNGQSLTQGFMVDFSRYMNQVIEINHTERWATVQAGVVKDHLNQLTSGQNLFFSPELSTSNRATIGGMINTDACGYGSIVYGKTSHHVLELTCVLTDGSIIESMPVQEKNVASLFSGSAMAVDICCRIQSLYKNYNNEIKKTFPPLCRSLTGYDLASLYNDKNDFNLNAILCGSEGTLAFITEAKIKLQPVPRYFSVVIILYDDFISSLEDTKTLLESGPTGIETIDSTVLNCAKQHKKTWDEIKNLLPPDPESADGINFVSFESHSQWHFAAAVKKLEQMLSSKELHNNKRRGYIIHRNRQHIDCIWRMRKQAVGLLSNMKGDAKPIPFVEDVVVPPENLASFIYSFRKILDQHALKYGMFGHCDAGVLHVRPAIDMKDPEQEKLIRTITDEVVILAQKHGGILWGEHGKGFRSEYTAQFFGKLYPALQDIKKAFDPDNRLNPGKIATPEPEIKLVTIDQPATRGQSDRQITPEAAEHFSAGLNCNGNGACFNFSLNDVMCPTYKATGDRRMSPKGRSSLVREWLKIKSLNGFNINKILKKSTLLKSVAYKFIQSVVRIFHRDLFTQSVYQALNSCMSCKGCTNQCPVQINTPEIRSRFFELYYENRFRPIKHTVLSQLESMLPMLSRYHRLFNQTTSHYLIKRLIANITGLIDLPPISGKENILTLQQAGAIIAKPALLAAIRPEEKQRCVILVQDAYTHFFEIELVSDIVKLLIKLGLRPFIAPYHPDGKVLHVYGYRNEFHAVARKQIEHLSGLANFGIPLVGIDTASTLIYRDEYRHLPKKLNNASISSAAVSFYPEKNSDQHNKNRPGNEKEYKKESYSKAKNIREKISYCNKKNSFDNSKLNIPQLAENPPEVLCFDQWLAGHCKQITKVLKPLNLSGRFRLLSHCTEVTSSPESIQNWCSIYQAAGVSLNHQPAGCCGMSGAFGHETANQAVSEKLFNLTWRPVLKDDCEAFNLVATGFSCRCQVKRLAGKSILHPAQRLLKLAEKALPDGK